MAKCDKKTEVYSRIVGYFRPIANWNEGKAEEFRTRKTFHEEKSLETPFASQAEAITIVK